MSTSTPPIPETYRFSEPGLRTVYIPAVRAHVQRRLQGAGVDYRSPYQEYGGPPRDIYEGLLHMPLMAASELSLSLDAAPPPLSLPLHSGTGHATYWTREQQRALAGTVFEIYREVVQAIDDIYERFQAHVATMLDATNDDATRQSAWAAVRRLHTPASDTVRRATLEGAVARVRARTDPPATDIPAFAGVHQDRLRAAGERHLRWLLGDPPRPTSSQETEAADRIARVVREYALRIARAADAGEVRIEHATGVRAVEAVTIGAAPRWRQIRSGAPAAGLSGPTPVTLPTVTPATPPFRAAVIEAWSAPAEPGQPETAQPTVIESAVSADPSKLRATVVRGATIGVDRLVLDWLVEAPGDPVTVTASARNVNGASRRTFIVPAPVSTGD